MILVPAGALDRPAVRPTVRQSADTEGPAVRPLDSADMPAIAAVALAALEDAVAALREQFDVANARAERAEADESDEQRRADDLRAQIEVLNTEMAVMRAEADLVADLAASTEPP